MWRIFTTDMFVQYELFLLSVGLLTVLGNILFARMIRRANAANPGGPQLDFWASPGVRNVVRQYRRADPKGWLHLALAACIIGGIAATLALIPLYAH